MASSPEPRRRIGRRAVILLAAALLVIAAVGAGWVAWYSSDEFIESRQPSVSENPDQVLAVRTDGGARSVTLRASAATTRPGTWSISWNGGAALVGDVTRRSPGRVERPLLHGTVPMTGQQISVSSSFPGDPRTRLGLDFSETMVRTELGDAPAWYIPAARTDATTWAIMVHGSNARRHSTLHAAAAMHRAGLPVLVISYRNDLGAPRSPDGLLHIGASEWRDLESAVRTAQSGGARRVVLYGGSMGGAVVGQFLTHSALRGSVAAAVLENPVASPWRANEWQLTRRHLPAVVARLSDEITDRRAGIDVRRIDMLDHPPGARPPTLLLHGDADQSMPVKVSRELAAAAPRSRWPIQYAEFPGAGHGEVWNSDPARYERLLDGFLARAVAPRGD